MSGRERAWGWVEHLRAGGTTPWSAWRGTAPARASALPGAQQLALLHRLNTVPGDRLRPGLADRVLATTAAGRGPLDLPLAGAEEHRWGPAPVDPSRLPARQLLRVASTVLAQDAVAGVVAPEEPTPDPDLPPRVRLRGREHVLVGDPWTASDLAARLPAAGRLSVGARALVLAGPFDELLVRTWSWRCFDHGVARWEEWLEFWAGRDQVPGRLDLAEAVRRAGVRRASRVRVVTSVDHLGRTVARGAVAPLPGADAAELARRISMVARILVPREQAARVLRTRVLPALPPTSTPPVRVPQERRDWVERAAAGVARELRLAGYPVLGDLADLAPRRPEQAYGPQPERRQLDDAVLDLAVRMLREDTLNQPTQDTQSTQDTRRAHP